MMTTDVDQLITRYFTEYFERPPTITSSEYDLVKSFFQEKTSSIESSAALTAAVIIAADDLNIPIVDIIAKFSASPINELKVTLPMFLNLSRKGSSLLGYLNDISPSDNVNRQISN